MTNASTETKPKAAHTPGPWAVNPFNAQVDAFATGEPPPICRLLWPTDVRSEEETEANAKLIAAAPDLLEALQQLHRFACDAPRLDFNEDQTLSWLAIWTEKARAAIAKARGES